MADGRSGGPGRRGERSGGDDNYDWLYSGSPRGSGSPSDEPEDADSTRVLPTFDQRDRRRPADQGPPKHIAPTPSSRPPSGPPPSARRPTGSSRRRGGFRPKWLLYLFLAWLVFLVAVPVYAWTSVSKVDADPGGDRPDDQPGTTYLVVGSDAREGLSGQRTDTIMLLRTGDGPNVLMSIPRDSLVEVPEHGVTKINSAFALGGPKLMVQTVEQSTGIRVDEYVEMGFAGLVQLVDAVGGIEICPEEAMNDPLAELDIEAGCQEADGETALGYARSRKTQALGDIDRARHQREVVSAIGSEVLSWQTIVNPVRYWNVVNAGAESVKVSDGTGPIAAAQFALGMTRVDGENGKTCSVPIANLEVQWDAERAEQLFTLIREGRTDEISEDLCQPTGMPQQ